MELNDKGGTVKEEKAQSPLAKEHKYLMIGLVIIGAIVLLSLMLFIYLFIREKQNTIDI